MRKITILLGLLTTLNINLKAQSKYTGGKVDRYILNSKYEVKSVKRVGDDCSITKYSGNNSYSLNFISNSGISFLSLIKLVSIGKDGHRYFDCSTNEYFHIEDNLNENGTFKLIYIKRDTNGDYMVLNIYNLKPKEE